MEIIPRSDWGPRYRAGFGAVSLPVRELWLHHSVTGRPAHDRNAERAAMRTLENIGQQRFGGGISYTFAVMPSGRIYEGTGAGRLGAHTYRRNSISHAFVLVGDYNTIGPSQAQKLAIAEAMRYGRMKGWWREARLNGGHRDVKATGCPGDAAYASIPHINELAHMAPAVTSEEDEVLIPINLKAGEDVVLHIEPHGGHLGLKDPLLVLNTHGARKVPLWVWQQRGGPGAVTVEAGKPYVLRPGLGGYLHIENRGTDADIAGGTDTVGGQLMYQKI